jgi:organic radical activating enzyme
MPYLASDHNPYVEAFWKWWPEMYQDLHTFRITGGEPLLSKDTFKLLDYIIETPNPNKKLSLCINSNLGIPKKLFDEFVLKVEKNSVITDNTPHAIAAGVVYFVAKNCNININKLDIKKVCGISEVTVNKCYKKLEAVKTQLLPNCFLQSL